VADCIGREWQAWHRAASTTICRASKRFNLEYIGADNTPHQPVMIHRAPFGSFERFVGMLIEHFAGAFPLWARAGAGAGDGGQPKSEEYGHNVQRQLTEAGLRVSGDYRAEKIGAKIRDAQLELTPYMFVLGAREAEAARWPSATVWKAILGLSRWPRPSTSSRRKSATKRSAKLLKARPVWDKKAREMGIEERIRG